MEAGKNNEYREPNACGLGPFGLRHSSRTNSSTKRLRPRWRDPMIFFREASAAVVLVALTLSLQCAGMAALSSFEASQKLRQQRLGHADGSPVTETIYTHVISEDGK